MEKIVEFTSRVGIDKWTPDQCSEMFEHLGSESVEDHELWNDLENLSQTEMVFLTEQVVGKIDSTVVIEADDSLPLKQTLVFGMLSLKKFVDPNARILNLRLILRICGIPGASAHSLVNSHVLHSLLTTLQRVTTEESSKSNKPTKTRVRRVNNTQSSQAESDDSAGESESEDLFAQSQATTRTRAKSNTAVAHLTNKALSAILVDLGSNVSLFLGSDGSLMELLSETVIAILFLCEMKAYLSEDEVQALLLNIVKHSQAAFMCVLKSIITAIIMTGRDLRIPDNTQAKTQCHKAAIKLIVNIASHCVDIESSWGVTTIVATQTQATNEDSSPLPEREVDEEADDIERPARRNSAGDRRAASVATKHHMPYTGIVGLLQRLTLCAPDRANIRTLATQSIVSVIAALHHQTGDNASVAVEPALTEKERLAIHQYFNFLLKLSTCIKVGLRAFAMEIVSSVLVTDWVWHAHAHGDGNADGGLDLPRALLLTLVDRCGDLAPTVRVRAVNAISSLLESFQEYAEDADCHAHINAPAMRTKAAKCNLFLDLVLGMNAPASLRLEQFSTPSATVVSNSNTPQSAATPSTPASNIPTRKNPVDTEATPKTPAADVEHKAYNLLETLRARVNDDKPLVRVRAVSAFGLALRLKYPKYTRSLLPFEELASSSTSSVTETTEMQLEFVQMFICEDDVSMLMERCDDISISVRKCAIAALSELVKAKPNDIGVLDTWVTAVLPLVADPEASVQQKVASSVMDLVLDNLIAWHRQQHSSSRSKSSAARSRHISQDAAGLADQPLLQQRAHLSWQILSRIADVDQVKLLRDCIQVLIKQQNISCESANSSGSKLSLIEMLECAKYASCGSLSQQTTSAGSGVEMETDDFASSQDLLSQLRTEDPSLMSRAGWILLEALVGHEQVPVNTRGAHEGNEGKKSFNKAVASALKSADFVVRCFMQRRGQQPQQQGQSQQPMNNEVMDDEEVRMLKVLQMLAPQLPEQDAQLLMKTLVPLLSNLKQSPTAMTVGITTLYALSMIPHTKLAQAASTAVFHSCCTDVTRWCGQLFAVCYPVLMSYCWGNEVSQLSQVHSQSSSQVCTLEGLPSVHLHKQVLHAIHHPESATAVEASKAAIFMLGEISMLGFSIEEEEAHKFQVQTTAANSLPVFATAESGAFRVVIPEPLETLIKSLMAVNLARHSASEMITELSQQSQTDADTQPLVTASQDQLVCSVDIRAFAFVSMGKFCLRNKSLAQSMVNVYLRELSATNNSADDAAVTTSPALRSNALLVLGDLCVRYTQLIDRNVGSMAVCLQDESLIVRKHALVLLTQLLLQDYLKWKGLLLFRFLATVCDENSELAEFARVILRKTILAKHPDFLCQNLTQSVVVFNSWCDHPSYVAAQYAGSEGDGCIVNMDGVNMHGPTKRGSRLRLYQFMMEGFSEEQKIHVTATLVDDILSHAIDSNALSFHSRKTQDAGVSPANQGHETACEETLEDVFLILRSSLLKVGGGKKGDGTHDDDDAELEEATTTGQAAVAKAKSIVLKKLSRQHMVSQLLPVVSSLKHALESVKSPIQGALMEYMIFLMKNNKADVDQALSNDPCLRSEIEYDLKQYQKAKEAEQAAAAKRQQQQHLSNPHGTSVQKGPRPQSPARPQQSSKKVSSSSSVALTSVAAGASGAASVVASRTPRQALLALGRSSAVKSARVAEQEPEEETGNELADRMALIGQTFNHASSKRWGGSDAADEDGADVEFVNNSPLRPSSATATAAADENAQVNAGAGGEVSAMSMKRTNSGKRNASLASLLNKQDATAAAETTTEDVSPVMKRSNSKGKQEEHVVTAANNENGIDGNKSSRSTRLVSSSNGLIASLNAK